MPPFGSKPPEKTAETQPPITSLNDVLLRENIKDGDTISSQTLALKFQLPALKLGLSKEELNIFLASHNISIAVPKKSPDPVVQHPKPLRPPEKLFGVPVPRESKVVPHSVTPEEEELVIGPDGKYVKKSFIDKGLA